ncbi:hypothetical protein EAG11_03735 [Flavobacterium sp. 140616W15]|nr:hypothetical protein EAG11_03735 [Flavobacterium sp. 140616W15]
MSTAKVVLVKILTDMTKSGMPDSDYYPNFIGKNKIKRLKDTLFQSFVYVENLETSKFTLNMSEVPGFQKNGTYYKRKNK